MPSPLLQKIPGKMQLFVPVCPYSRCRSPKLEAATVRLSLADQECFAQALLSPPQPAPALDRAFERRRKLLQAE